MRYMFLGSPLWKWLMAIAVAYPIVATSIRLPGLLSLIAFVSMAVVAVLMMKELHLWVNRRF